MNFTPLNRHILIEIIDEEEENIPTADALSESYIIDSIPKKKYKLITENCIHLKFKLNLSIEST